MNCFFTSIVLVPNFPFFGCGLKLNLMELQKIKILNLM